MLNIDKNKFFRNLNLTQQYCRLQLDKNCSDKAEIFRSYNPTLNDKPLFSFEIKRFNFDIVPNMNTCTLTHWQVDPTERENERLIDKIFEQQINFKEAQKLAPIDEDFKGDILISQIDCTVIDGASEVQSFGLVDIYDMPPIDTWFYLTKTKESRLLFAWIPNEFKHYANEAVLVNCVDCINWFQEWYPKEYKEIMANAQQVHL
jgi:hypothetical protein